MDNLQLINLPLLSHFKSKIDALLEKKVNKTDIATTEQLGLIKPDGSTVFVDENGVLSSIGSGLGGGSASGALKPWMYETENEVLVGVYDGKPLYRRCIKVVGITGESGSFEISTLDETCNIVDFYGTAKLMDSIVPINTDWDNNYRVSLYLSSNTLQWKLGSWQGVADIAFNISIEYTKTTDTEGSGNNLSIYGGSLINYSTEEQNVGTWIDGRPIYQKTITDYDILNTANGTVLVAENIDFLTSLPIGFAKFTNATDGSFNYSPLPQIAGFADYQIGANVMNDGYVRIERGDSISKVNYSSIIATMTFQYTKTTDVTT